MKKLITGLWFPVLILMGWYVLAAMQVLDPLFFPSPVRLIPTTQQLWASGELPGHLRATLARLGLGMLLGAVPGLALGFLMGRVAVVRGSLDPLLSALYTTPKISLLPLLILVLGIGEAPRLTLIAVAAFLTMAIQTVDAVRGIGANYIEVAQSFGAGVWLMLRRVYFPASLPQILTGLRLAFGRALLATITVELFNCQVGIGSMILMSWQTFSPEKLYVGVIIAGMLGAISHGVFRWAEVYVVPWRTE